MPERPLVGQMQFGGMEDIEGIRPGNRSSVSAKADVSIPKVDKLNASVSALLKNFKALQDLIQNFANSGATNKLAGQLDSLAKGASAASEASTWGRSGVTNQLGHPPNVWESGPRRNPADIARGLFTTPTAAAASAAGPGGGGGGPGGVPPLGRTGPSTGETAASSTMGSGIANAAGNFLSNATGGNGIGGMLMAPITGLSQMWGALAGGSLQYTYNRINGPTGNMNAMLQLVNALAPNVTMMNAAGGTQGTGNRFSMQEMIQGLGQRMPVMGTQQDMIQTILAGQGVGALMAGTPNRNGFFESVRQMQALNPGQAPGVAAGGLAGYMQNTRAQQMGAFMGEGAFTMIGQGGRYKTLAEWAEGITKFFEQHRPGGAQGKGFTPEELITQNFPGSNINAWFQMMGVPQNMVDYWWQYVLTNTKGVPASQVTSDMLTQMVHGQRGMNLGVEQLRAATQSTRRDYLMGNQMYAMYGLNAAANRRFNVMMQGTDQALAHQLQSTNIGRMIALLPTPIMEMLMPLISMLITSPVGAAASALGGLFSGSSAGGGGGGGDLFRGIAAGGSAVVDAASSLFGDPMPYGAPAYGDLGGTNTAHLSPDLAKKVNAMMTANPALKMSSGYRDTVTQNRLRRNGASSVGHPSRSAHTRGWAADIGPASQMGWLMQNAGRFGLQTAAGQGEPWHIQNAGTMPYGDPISDLIGGAAGAGFGLFGGAVSGVLGDIATGVMKAIENLLSDIMSTLEEPITSLIGHFVGSGGFSSMIDTATNVFSRILTSPIAGLTNIAGKAGPLGGNLNDLINQEAPSHVSVIGRGFASSGNVSPVPIFGDPGGGVGNMASPTIQARIGAPIIFQTSVTISGVGTSGGEARRVATNILDHLENEADKRQWLSY